MTRQCRYRVINFFIVTFFLVLPFACANRSGGGPQGGEIDEDPPVMIKSSIMPRSVNVKEREFIFWFDENIQISKPQEKVIVTPPQNKMPDIKSFGRKAVVRLKDELIPNTTYVIDFTDAIEDYNEKNQLENFSFSFSTGDILDTLEMSGIVLNAENLEPDQGVYIGLHSNLNDSAFTNIAFERVSRTDSRGRFSIKGIAPGRYYIFALADINRDYRYSSPDERVAFWDSIIEPSSVRAFRQDTIFKDSITVDTVFSREITRFLPDDIVLRSFTRDFKSKYLKEHKRDIREKLILHFTSETDFPKNLHLLSPFRDSSDWFFSERSINNDTVTLWLRDSILYNRDTINISLSYLETDTLNNHILIDDTISFIYRDKSPKIENKPKDKEKNKNKDSLVEAEEESDVPEASVPLSFFNIKIDATSVIDIGRQIGVEFFEPPVKFDSSCVNIVKIENDSVELPIKYTIISDSLSLRKYVLKHEWLPGTSYKISIDSASVYSIYGLHNNKLEQKFSVKKLEEYGNLAIIPTGLSNPELVIVQLLNDKDLPVKEAKIDGDAALFANLNPGKYYVRLFVDSNQDGKWTTGDYGKKRIPEEVYYLNKSLEIKPNWDLEEEWNINDVKPPFQKPLEITKNKPEEKNTKNKKQEAQNRARSNGGSPRIQTR